MAMQNDLNRRRKAKGNNNNGSGDSGHSDSFLSLSTIGDQKEFGKIRQDQIDTEVNRMWIEFWIDIIILLVIVTFLVIDIRSNPKGCGIIVREWIIIFFVIWLSKSTFNLAKIYVLNNAYEKRLTFSAILFAVIYGLLIIWLIVGYCIYYSDKNDCASNPETSVANTIMLVILIVGYFIIFIYFVLICSVPCIYVHAQNQKDKEDKERKYSKDGNKLMTQKKSTEPSFALKTLSKTGYDPQLFHFENECKICSE